MYAQVRCSIRFIVLTIVMSCVMQFIIYELWRSSTVTLPCTSKENCYEHATKIGRYSSRTGSYRSRMSALRNFALRRQQLKNSLRTNDNSNSNEKRGSGSNELYGSEPAEERVNAAFVVLVRNRELHDMRASMR